MKAIKISLLILIGIVLFMPIAYTLYTTLVFADTYEVAKINFTFLGVCLGVLAYYTTSIVVVICSRFIEWFNSKLKEEKK